MLKCFHNSLMSDLLHLDKITNTITKTHSTPSHSKTLKITQKERYVLRCCCFLTPFVYFFIFLARIIIYDGLFGCFRIYIFIYLWEGAY